MATTFFGETKTYSAINIVTNPSSQPVTYSWNLPNGGGSPTLGSGSTFTVTWGNTTGTFPVHLTLTPTSNSCSNGSLLIAEPVTVSGSTWYGFNLTPVFAGTCDASGSDITAYNQVGGSLAVNSQLFASQNTGDPLPSGTYSNGSVRYTVNGGVITSIDNCAASCTSITSYSIVQS